MQSTPKKMCTVVEPCECHSFNDNFAERRVDRILVHNCCLHKEEIQMLVEKEYPNSEIINKLPSMPEHQIIAFITNRVNHTPLLTFVLLVCSCEIKINV